MNLLITFVALNTVNVIIQTIKSIATIKGGKLISAITNALAYGFYTVIVIYMMCELPLWQKALIIAMCNFIGVYVVKLFEEKLRKDKLWKVEMTVPERFVKMVDNDLQGIPHNYITVQGYAIFNSFCATQKETQKVNNVGKKYGAKYFVSETKINL